MKTLKIIWSESQQPEFSSSALAIAKMANPLHWQVSLYKSAEHSLEATRRILASANAHNPVLWAYDNDILRSVVEHACRQFCFPYVDSTRSLFTQEEIDMLKVLPAVIAGSRWRAHLLAQQGLTNVLFCPLASVAACQPRARTQGHDNSFTIFASASHAFEEGFDIVLDAFQFFSRKYPKTKLVCVAACAENGTVSLEQSIVASGASTANVLMHESLSIRQQQQILAQCDVAVLPYRSATGSSLAKSALASAVPTIISAGTAHIELLGAHLYGLKNHESSEEEQDEARFGWSKPSVEDLIRLLEKVYTKRSEATQKANQGLAFAKHYTDDAQVESLLRSIDLVLAQGKAAPPNTDELYRWAHKLHLAQEFAEASKVYNTVLKSDPKHIGAVVNLANIARDQGLFEMAAQGYRKALALTPSHAKLWQLLGNLQRANGQALASLESFSQALTCEDNAKTHWYIAYTLMLLGRFSEAWPHFEYRHEALGLRQPKKSKARWQGEPLQEGTLLVLDEQGIGDTLQFLRFLPLLPATKSVRIIFAGKPSTLELVRRVLPEANVYDWDKALPHFDLWVPLLSLPARLGVNSLNALPPPTLPVLSQQDLRKWQSKVRGDGEHPVIGVCWRGNPDFSGDAKRSPGLAALLPLLQLEGVRFVSLQVGPGRNEIGRHCLHNKVADLGAEIEREGMRMMDTMAALEHCDFVISSCTSVAHMAGVLGRPGCVLLAYSADWRWLQERDDSPWYPSLKLLRQPRPGDWDFVVDKAKESVRHFCTRAEV